MDRLILCPSGIWRVEWNSNKRQHEQARLHPDILALGWSHSAAIEGLKLRDLIRFLMMMSKKRLELLEILSDSHIKPYLDQLKRTGKKGHSKGKKEPEPDSDPITFLEVSKHFALKREHKTKRHTWEPKIEATAYCSGCTGTPDKPTESYGIELTPIEELLDADIIVRDTAKVIEEIEYKHKPLGDFKVWWSLGEILTAILDEICFFGAPSTQRAKAVSIKKQVAEIQSGTLKGKLHSWDDLDAKWTKQQARDAARQKRIDEGLWLKRHPEETSKKMWATEYIRKLPSWFRSVCPSRARHHRRQHDRAA